MWMSAAAMGIADGPTEVHKVTLARQVLRDYEGYEGVFPPEHIPTRREALRGRFADLLEHEVGNT
jgi:acyl-CoA dehydrogenase